jgi:hypothetical protein
MKKDQIKEKLNITFSETPSKKNTSQSCSESNTLVKNDPFLNVIIFLNQERNWQQN